MAHILSGRAETPIQSRILTLVRDEGPLDRIDLAGRLGVSRTTVAAETGRLVELSLAVDGGPAASRGGRRSTLVDLHPRLRFVGVQLGATSLRVAVTDGRLGVLRRAVSAPANIRRGPEVVLAETLDLIRKLLAEEGVERPAGVGMGVPGPVDFQRGMPVSPPLMPGWDGYPVREALSRELGAPVLLDNDVNVMALGEQQAGVARRAADYLFIKIGTGIGCGIIVGGHLYRGADGSAGDVGHIRAESGGPVCACGNQGCLEAFFGGAALARDATSAAQSGRSSVLADLLDEHGALTAAHVGEALNLGDAVALQLTRDGGRRAGSVLAGLVSFFNPSLIVIGGGVGAGLGHTLLAEIRSSIYRQSLPLATGKLPVVLSELGDDSGVVGAARLISDAVYAVA